MKGTPQRQRREEKRLQNAFPHALYVSTDMAILPEEHYVYSYYAKNTFPPEILKTNYHEVDLNGKIYRRMSPRYLAWMGRQMEGLRKIVQQSASSRAKDAFETVEAVFSQVETWCVWKFGEEVIQEVIRKEMVALAKNKNSYRPPSRGVFIRVGMAREGGAFLK